jgi:hypothetical protein
LQEVQNIPAIQTRTTQMSNHRSNLTHFESAAQNALEPARLSEYRLNLTEEQIAARRGREL